MHGQKTHPAGLIPLLLLLAALAGGASAQAPAGSSFRSGSSPSASVPPESPEPAPAMEPGPPSAPVRALALSRPAAASAEHKGWTRILQAGVPALLLTLGLSDIASLGLYSLTDRVEARLGPASPPPRARKAADMGSTASLRAETRFILLRL